MEDQGLGFRGSRHICFGYIEGATKGCRTHERNSGCLLAGTVHA